MFSLFLQGFCGWSLVVYDRLLVPSNPAIGVLRYKDNYYAFCDKHAAYEFSSAPDRLAIMSTDTLDSKSSVCVRSLFPFTCPLYPPCDRSFPAEPISIRNAQSRKKSPHTFAHLVNFSKNVSAMFDNH